MGFFSKLFSSKDLVEDISDGVDKIWHTDEEKAEKFPKLLELYKPFKLAQRYMMVIFCVPYVIIWFLTALLAFTLVVRNVYCEIEDQINVLATINPMTVLLTDGATPYIVGLIAALYFGGGLLESKNRKIGQ